MRARVEPSETAYGRGLSLAEGEGRWHGGTIEVGLRSYKKKGCCGAEVMAGVETT